MGRVLFITDTAKAGWETVDNGATFVGNDKWFSDLSSTGTTANSDRHPLASKLRCQLHDAWRREDRSKRDRLYIAEGIGVWWTKWPQTFSAFNLPVPVGGHRRVSRE